MNSFFKKIKACVLAILTLSILVFSASCADDYNEEYEKRLDELIHQKQELVAEKNKLTDNMGAELGNSSYMSFVFTQLDSALYTDVYPIMSDGEIKIVGVMALSEDELPGSEGKITAEQYSELMSLGWGDALYWNGESELSAFLNDMSTRLASLGIDMPESMVFAEGTYSFSLDETLLNFGIKNIVHSGEENLRYIEKSAPEAIWRPGRIGWRWIGKSTSLKKTIEKEHGYALFEVTFDNSAENSRTSFFPIIDDSGDSDRVSVFKSMISLFKTSVAEGEIEVFNIEETRARMQTYYADLEALELATERRIEEIESQINEISRKITELYNEFY